MLTLITVIPGSGKHKRGVYRCQCGTEIVALVDNVRRGHTKSCGCLRRKVTSERTWKHGHRVQRTRAYVAWVNMKARCDNKNRADYKNYGGRGVTYAGRWRSFANFLTDMGEPEPNMTLERVDNSRGYSNANCKWAPRSAQNLNRRNNVLYTFNGKSQTLSQWSRETGIGRLTLLKRIQRGVPLELALTVRGFLKVA